LKEFEKFVFSDLAIWQPFLKIKSDLKDFKSLSLYDIENPETLGFEKNHNRRKL